MAGSPTVAEPPREAPAFEAEAPGAAWSEDSGTVSQSPSRASGAWEDEAAEELALLRRAAAGCAACLLPGPGPGPEAGALDAGLEELLSRVDEFAGVLDMLRGDSSHVVSEGVPRIHARAAEMRRVYGRIDRLEAFVGMVGRRVARMEEHVARAEAELGALPRALARLLHAVHAPARLRRHARAAPEPPALFRTEDHFPSTEDHFPSTEDHFPSGGDAPQL